MERQDDKTGTPETQQKVNQLKEQLRQYKETKRVLDQKMESGATKKVETAEIKQMQKQLEQLELTGKDIKKLFDATVHGRQANFSYNETHFDDSKYRRRGTGFTNLIKTITNW